MIFTVVLRNTPVYSLETLRWLKQFEHLELSGNQKRLLAYAKEHDGRFTSRAYQKLVGVDIYTASRDIKDLIRKGLVRRTKKGGRVYRVVEPEIKMPVEISQELHVIAPKLLQKGYIKNEDVRRLLKVNRIQATRFLSQLVDQGYLEKKGERRWTYYVPTSQAYEALSGIYESPSQKTIHSEDDS